MIAMETATYLGPATAREIDGRRVLVDLRGETFWARLATPFVPAGGDEVLVARLEADAYVLGILSDGPVTLRAPEVRVETGKFELAARRIVERAADVYRWVSDLLHTKSRRSRTVVEEDYQVRAGTADLRARGDVNVDGRSINLG